ncbi:MAG TPA: TonB-dependent receptor [Vicinamibacterales bacterium]|nr:TonB-dependent receptor [Vicinamibacterales bacterium]
MVRFIRAYLAVAVLAIGFAPAVAQAQTGQVGQVAGDVKDATGGLLAGASVTLASVDRGFSRVTVTDGAGRFHFPVVPLGRYTVTVKLPNFETVTLANNLVEANRTTSLVVTLKVAPIETTTMVVGRTPIVDVTNQTQETRLRVDEFAKLAVARNYQALVGLAAGVVGTGNVNSHGALSTNNIFMFDGVNTTDPTTGTFGANLNYEAIQEVVVRTSTAGVEFGRGTGAIVDVITRSGTNKFAGSFKYLATNDNWNTQNTAVNEVTGESLARTKFDHVNPAYSGTIGGPIKRDRAWFFMAYEQARVTSPEQQTNAAPGFANQEYQQTTNSPFWTMRVTTQLAHNQSLWLKYSTSPTNGFVIDYWGNAAELQSLTTQNQKGDNWAGQYNGVIGTKWTATVMASKASAVIDVIPFETGGSVDGGAPIVDLNDSRWYNGATFDGRVDRPRTQASGALEYFSGFGGRSHAIKFGADWQRVQSVNYFRFPADKVFYVFNFNPNTRTYDPFVYEQYDNAPSTSKGDQLALYARDRFELGPRVSVEAGLRLEHQTGTSDIGVGTVNAWVFAPRVSASVSLTDDSRTIVVGSWGRFHDNILQGFSDAFASVPQQTNYNSYQWDGSQYVFSYRNEQGGSTFAPNLDVTPRYMDEMTAGFERQVSNTLGIGLRVISRNWKNFIDDVQSFAPDGSVTRVVQNIADGERTYRGVEFTLDKRFADNWSAQGSYTFSRTRGNHFADDFTALDDFTDAICQQSVDPLLGDPQGKFPCAEIQSRLSGTPAFDRPHLAKFAGAYHHAINQVDLTAGLVTTASSLVTYSKTRTVSVLVPDTDIQATTLTYNYDGLGSERIPGMVVTADVALEGTFRVGRSTNLGVKFETFNLFNSQDKIGVTNTAWCNDNTTSSCQAVRESFGTATTRSSFVTPRTYRLSFVVRF